MSGLKHLAATLALCAAGVSASAQDVIPVSSVHYAGRYDVATQTFHPSTVDPDLAPTEGTAAVLFDNSTTNGSLTTGGGALATSHYMDWGTASFGGAGAVITDIRIGYGTNLVAPGTVDLRIRLYQGATGGGNFGTVIGDYNLTGLPNSASGGFEGFTVDVTLPTPLNMADGAIGWSYNSDASDPLSTGPLTVGPPNEVGVLDEFDVYLESDDSYQGTFFFGGTPFASFVMRLTGTANSVPPSAWTKYGSTAKVVKLNGIGPGTPGSENTIKVKSTVPTKPVILVVGVVQSNIFSPNLNLQFYALPWIAMFGPVVPNPSNALYQIPFIMPPLGVVNPGDEVFFQAFGQNLSNQYVNYSKGLKLTIQ